MAGSLNKVFLIGLYLQGKSIPDLASITGHSRSAVRYHLLKAGVLRSRSDGVRLSAHKISSAHKGRPKLKSEQTKKRISASALARGEMFARGVRITSQGYAEFTRGANKGRLVHRVLAECLLGRRLFPGEVVHHLDGNKVNNAPGNLMVMSNREHNRIHAQSAHESRERCQNGRFA